VMKNPIRKRLQVITQLDSGTCFAVDPCSGEQTFIGSRICKMNGVGDGDIVDVFVVPNDRSQTVPWFAVYVTKVSDELSEVPAQASTIDDSEILRFLEGGLATTTQICQNLGVDLPVLVYRLVQLHNEGQVARAGVRARSGQDKDTVTLWALCPEDFLPEAADA
jgi:hypothetical protein